MAIPVVLVYDGENLLGGILTMAGYFLNEVEFILAWLPCVPHSLIYRPYWLLN